MRAVYAERQQVLVRATERELAEWLSVEPAATGLHLVGWLRQHRDDVRVAQNALSHGIETAPLSYFHLTNSVQPGLDAWLCCLSGHTRCARA